ncbi:MAG: heme-copper oxidase subunit III [Planctomycetes bacterium]|nr:heme-copper oxidase subunit III [Planctomycetota bacterium]
MIAGTVDSKRVALAPRAIDARIGMMLFLASWGMVFLTLFFSYAVLRFQAPVWPPADVPPLPTNVKIFAWTNTILMIVSSVFLKNAFGRRLNSPRSIVFVGATMLCGLVFLFLQIETWLELWRPGMYMSDGTYQSLFYLLTGFHALHVAAGLLLFIWTLPGLRALAGIGPRPTADRAIHYEVRAYSVSMFWHFVDVAWLATFAVVYFT